MIFYLQHLTKFVTVNYYSITLHDTGTQPQQCPYDFPYVFNDGKSCCRYNKDHEGLSLTFGSTTCEKDLHVLCSTERCRTNGEQVKLIR